MQAKLRGILVISILCVLIAFLAGWLGGRSVEAKHARKNSLAHFGEKVDAKEYALSTRDFLHAAGLASNPNDCSKDDAGWISWRDAQVDSILTPTAKAKDGEYPGEPLLKRDDVNKAAANAFSILDACVQADPARLMRTPIWEKL